MISILVRQIVKIMKDIYVYTLISDDLKNALQKLSEKVKKWLIKKVF